MNQMKIDNSDEPTAEEDLEAIRRGLEQSFAGEGQPAAEFFREFEEKHKIGKRFQKAEDA